ncbi:MAG: NAD(P)/FAD-dependent oxidoreductase [Acetivibrionales bacterium]|jgi:glycerol-3-phosphate dehydrogenase
MYDVIIIGAGVTGSAIARELSKNKVNACVLEKEEDVCCGTTKANSAIIHAGFDAAHGSLMAKMNVSGNLMMDELVKDLDIPYRKNGSLVICLSEEDRPKLQELYERGMANGVKELRILTREEVLQIEPNLSESVTGALYAPTAGIICPFDMTVALAENAFQNGITFFFNTEVLDVVKIEEGYLVKTNKKEYTARCLVNAAGVYADKIHNMVSNRKITITPRRGDYIILDKAVGTYVDKTIFTVPGKLGKGVLISPTVHGNLIVGPTAIDIDDKEATATTKEGLDEVIIKAGMIVKQFPIRQVITSFAGLRAHEAGHEFIIGEAEDAQGFIDAAGIESPGLTSAPAIGVMVADLLKEKMDLVKKDNFIATRKGILNPQELSLEDRKRLIKEKPEYGTVICRCETVTEGEILDAIHRPLGAKSLDGVKRRTRAGMGRCQSGFCLPKVMGILARELDLSWQDITKSGGASTIITARTK